MARQFNVRTGVVIEGGDDLLRRLREMGELNKPILQRAVNAGASIVKHAALRLVPVGRPSNRKPRKHKSGPGQLRRAIRIILSRVRKPNRAAAAVGVRSTDAFYAPFVHQGHRIVRKRKGQRARPVGFVRGRPFLVQALDSNEDRVSQAFGNVIMAELEKLFVKR